MCLPGGGIGWKADGEREERNRFGLVQVKHKTLYQPRRSEKLPNRPYNLVH